MLRQIVEKIFISNNFSKISIIEFNYRNSDFGKNNATAAHCANNAIDGDIHPLNLLNEK